MALSNQSDALNRTSDEGKLPCCYTDLYPGEEHFREYKKAQKEKKEFVPKQPPGGMSSGDGATVTVLDMDETGVKGRARRRRSVGGQLTLAVPGYMASARLRDPISKAHAT